MKKGTYIGTLISGALTTGVGASSPPANSGPSYSGEKTFQATVTTTAGNGSATVNIEVSNDQVAWIVLTTITLASASSPVSDGFPSNAAWGYYRANVTAISGTNAALTVTCCQE